MVCWLCGIFAPCLVVFCLVVFLLGGIFASLSGGIFAWWYFFLVVYLFGGIFASLSGGILAWW